MLLLNVRWKDILSIQVYHQMTFDIKLWHVFPPPNTKHKRYSCTLNAEYCGCKMSKQLSLSIRGTARIRYYIVSGNASCKKKIKENNKNEMFKSPHKKYWMNASRQRQVINCCLVSIRFVTCTGHDLPNRTRTHVADFYS